MMQALEAEEEHATSTAKNLSTLRSAPHPGRLNIVKIAPALAGRYAEVEVTVDASQAWALWEDDRRRPKGKGKAGKQTAEDGRTDKIAFITGYRQVQLLLSDGRGPHVRPLHGILLSRTLAGKKGNLGRVQSMLLLVEAQQVPRGYEGSYITREMRVQNTQIPAKMFGKSLHTPIAQLKELHGWLTHEPVVPVQRVPARGLFTDPNGLLQSVLGWTQYLQTAYSERHYPEHLQGCQWVGQEDDYAEKKAVTSSTDMGWRWRGSWERSSASRGPHCRICCQSSLPMPALAAVYFKFKGLRGQVSHG